jgi:thiamine transporter ThiT
VFGCVFKDVADKNSSVSIVIKLLFLEIAGFLCFVVVVFCCCFSFTQDAWKGFYLCIYSLVFAFFPS